MKVIDIFGYVEGHKGQLVEAGQRAHDKLGRGALCIFPQRNEGDGKASVCFLTEATLEEDSDPALPIVQRYHSESEVVLIVGMDNPKSVYTYLVSNVEVKLALLGAV